MLFCFLPNKFKPWGSLCDLSLNIINNFIVSDYYYIKTKSFPRNKAEEEIWHYEIVLPLKLTTNGNGFFYFSLNEVKRNCLKSFVQYLFETKTKFPQSEYYSHIGIKLPSEKVAHNFLKHLKKINGIKVMSSKSDLKKSPRFYEKFWSNCFCTKSHYSYQQHSTTNMANIISLLNHSNPNLGYIFLLI